MGKDLARVKVRIGDWREGDYHYRLVVEARLSVTEGQHQTIHHELVTDPVRLSIAGDVRERRDGSSYWREGSGGQVVEAVESVTAFGQQRGPGAGLGWDADRCALLAATWRRWHLNDMRAACAHMPDDAHERWNAGKLVECAAGTGYMYGKAWLVEELPADVLATLVELFGDKFTI